ncbi:DUF1214 domain-containing protein [Rhizobium sp. RAF56]|uniref:DUF1214 domain-containing protein n=1 Tax=Rhizobium sp. RAF56 TaxID=3233062 RepID=UPI003F959B25
MYAADMLFVENDFKRYSIGSTTDGLKKEADGSLTILIHKDRPSAVANWLPAPEGGLQPDNAALWPETSVLDGTYRLPAVRHID